MFVQLGKRSNWHCKRELVANLLQERVVLCQTRQHPTILLDQVVGIVWMSTQ